MPRLFFICLLLILGSANTALAAGSRIKDLTTLAGARDNQLVGYGLVVGLAGDGDKDPIYTVQSIANMLQRFGITVPSSTLSSKNVAAVIVTADIPAFMKNGSRLDVTVAAMGDAKSLQGGVLLQCPLRALMARCMPWPKGRWPWADFSEAAAGAGERPCKRTIRPSPKLSGGALVEKEIPMKIIQNNTLDLLLRDPDFTSASRIAAAINEAFTNALKPWIPPQCECTSRRDSRIAPVDFIARWKPCP